MIKTSLAACLITAPLASYADAEYLRKPVLCGNEIEILGMLSSKEEDLTFEAIQTTPVLSPDTDNGVRAMPAMLPIAVYMNINEKTYSIVEYHPGYDQYCIVSLGGSIKFNVTKEDNL